MSKLDRQKLDKLRQEILDEQKMTKTYVTVCGGTGCHAYDSMEVAEEFKREIKAIGLKDIEVRITGCHGFCERGPITVIKPDGIFYQRVQIKDVKEVVTETLINGKIIDGLLYEDPQTGKKIEQEEKVPFYNKQERIIFGNNGFIDPTEIKDYIAVGGYAALAKTLNGISREDVVNEVKDSNLRGRGGAGFPTGRKWEITAAQKNDTKYVICNCDEGDPGAYMDRSLMEGNPHSVIEGMAIGAYAIGAKEGYLYIRDEYPLAITNTQIAIEQAREMGLLGKDIMGTDFSFDLHIFRGAGAFVSGEESALLVSIEGKIGIPKQRPPYPAQRGLWGKPTNINNVETWANIPYIINKGAKWYTGIGTEGSKGTKIFSLVGKINNTGLVEVPMGMTLREVIFDIGGGIPGGKKFKAVQTGGPSGGCLPKDMLDLPIDYKTLTDAGSIMGSGGMIIMDESTCMVDIAKYFLNFLRDESCGKCMSCREGTQRMWEIVSNICDGKGEINDLNLLEELAEIVRDASMCGLGQTAANPVLSTLKHFRNEYEEHILKKQCPAMVCKEIVSAPCQYICPIDQEASVYIALIAQEKFKEAYEVIRKDNPLPSVCGRVCDHQCESVCRAGEIDKPIAIRALKRFIMDWAAQNGKDSTGIMTLARKNKKVAIVGSGPAGLSAGYKLNLLGYDTTIFESQPVAGGMLALGIPEHRLPKDILNADIQYILKSGVKLITNKTLGKDFTIDGLFKEGYEAVFLATGAYKSLRLNIADEDAEGVIPGMKLLTQTNLKKGVVLGKKVGIIGGGNAAIDAARVATRNRNTTKVTILYRRTRKEMPAYEEEIENSIEEGIEIHFLVAPIRVLTDNGRVKGIECIKMELGKIDESGRRRPIPIEGSEFTVELDTLIPAIGERPDLSYIEEKDKLRTTKWDTIVVNEDFLSTEHKGVYAGGDVVTGPNTVIKAVAAGKNAAESIDKYLQGKSLEKEYKLRRPSQFIKPVELTEEEVECAHRLEMPLLSVKDRHKNFMEVATGFTQEMAVKEARRCLRCELETEDGKKAMGQEK